MSPQATLDLIKQLTDELAQTYDAQAELVTEEIDAQYSLVGEYKEWRCTAWLCTTGGYYSESEPNGWTKTLHWPNLRGEPHTRQGEATEALDEAKLEYNTNVEDQLTNQEHIAMIPTNMGGFIMDWFEVDTQFASIYYPANTYEVGAPGEAWLSSTSANYESAVGEQRGAADLTKGVVGNLVTNSTAFLGSVTDTIATFADLALQQEQNYIDAIAGFAQDFSSIGGFINAIKSGVQAIKNQRDHYYNQVQSQATLLSSALDSVVSTGLVANDLTGIGPGGQWPGPKNVSRDADNPDCVSQDEIRTDAEWFGAHIAYWEDITADMGTLKTSADDTSTLPIVITEMPHFTAAQSTVLNDLGGQIQGVIGGGHTAAQEVVDALTDTIRNYLDNELASEAEANEFFDEYVDN